MALPYALLHVVDDTPLRWHTAGDIDACAGERAPHEWCVMLPLYTLMALGRYRNALVRQCCPERPSSISHLSRTSSLPVITWCFPAKGLDAHPPVTRDVFYALSLFLQFACGPPRANSAAPRSWFPPPHTTPRYACNLCQALCGQSGHAARRSPPRRLLPLHGMSRPFDLTCAKAISHAAGLTSQCAWPNHHSESKDAANRPCHGGRSWLKCAGCRCGRSSCLFSLWRLKDLIGHRSPSEKRPSYTTELKQGETSQATLRTRSARDSQRLKS